MELLRECWNKRITPEQFISLIPEQQEIEFSKHLLSICGSDFQPCTLFLDYLEKLLHKPSVCEEVFCNISDYDKSGLISLLKYKGQILFNHLDVGSENAAKCALNALSLCLETGDQSQSLEIIDKLTETSKFGILIASSRMYFPTEFEEISHRAKNVILNPNVQSSIPFPMNLLRRALFSPKITKAVLFSRHDLTLMTLSNIILDSPDPTCLSFLELPTFYHLYLHAVTNYLTNPSLHSAFLVTNLLVRVYVKLTGGDTEKLSVDRYSDVYLPELLSKLQNLSHDESEFLSENRENCDYLNQSTDYSTLSSILINNEISINDSDLIEYTLKNPSFSSEIVDHVSGIVRKYDTDFKSFIISVLNHFDDFLNLMIRQHKFFTFLQTVLNLSLSMIDRDPVEDFEMYLYFGLSLIRTAWGTGNKNLRQEIEVFIQGQDSENMKHFLTQFLHPHEHPNYIVLDKNYRFNTLVKFMKKLNENSKFELTLNDVTSPNYILILIKALDVDDPRPIIDLLRQKKLPHFPCVDILFRQILTKNGLQTKRQLVWKRVDYDTIMQNRPEVINDITPMLIDQLNMISHDDNLQDEFNDILTIWSAWSDLFGFDVFCSFLIEKVVWKTAHAYVPDDASSLFGSVAFVLCLLVNGDEKMIDKAIEIGLKSINEYETSMTVCVGLSQFILSFVCVCTGDWMKRFTRVINESMDIIYQDFGKGDPEFFALSIIKTSLLMPSLQTAIPDDVVHALLKVDDAKCIIDYFIVKSDSQKSNSDISNSKFQIDPDVDLL